MHNEVSTPLRQKKGSPLHAPPPAAVIATRHPPPQKPRLTLVPVRLVLLQLVRLPLLPKHNFPPADARPLIHLRPLLDDLALPPPQPDQLELALDRLGLGRRPRREAGAGALGLEAGDEGGEDGDLGGEAAGGGGGLLARVGEVEGEGGDGGEEEEWVQEREGRGFDCAGEGGGVSGRTGSVR